MVTLDGTRTLLVHATPRDPLDEYALPDADFWTRRLQGVVRHDLEPRWFDRAQTARPEPSPDHPANERV